MKFNLTVVVKKNGQDTQIPDRWTFGTELIKKVGLTSEEVEALSPVLQTNNGLIEMEIPYETACKWSCFDQTKDARIEVDYDVLESKGSWVIGHRDNQLVAVILKEKVLAFLESYIQERKGFPKCINTLRSMRLNEIVEECYEVETDPGNHEDSQDEYATTLDFYTSEVKKEAYITYLIKKYDISEDDAYWVQAQVLERICENE